MLPDDPVLNAAPPIERLSGVTYYSRKQLEEESPTRRDGVSAAQEAAWRNEYTAIISEAGMRLRIPQWAIYTAAQLCHRFYAVRSMARNDIHLISAACLFLSAKLQEFPKRASDTAMACDHVRFFRAYEERHERWRARQPQPPPDEDKPPPPGEEGQQQQQKKQQQKPPRAPSSAGAADPEPTRWWEERAHVHQRRDELLVAERAVLFALNFSLATAGHPYASLLRWVAELDWRRAARAEAAANNNANGKGGDGKGDGGTGENNDKPAAEGEEEAEEQQVKRRAAAMSRDVLHVAWNLVTDSARTQLALRHPPAKIAAAALYSAALATGRLPLPPLVAEAAAAEAAEAAGEPPAAAAGEPDRAAFFRRYRITAEELEDIVTELMDASEALCDAPAAAAAAGGGDDKAGAEAGGGATTEAAADAKRQRVDGSGGGGGGGGGDAAAS